MNWESEIFGHEKVLEQIRSDIEKDAMPHAVLFAGPKGVGKFRMARYIAYLIDGVDPVAARQIEHNIHPDVVCLGDLWQADRLEDWSVISHSSNFDQSHRSGKDGDAPKRTDTIGVKDIHSFLRPLSQRPQTRRNIGIIRDSERLTTEAANSLLKVLEEPPERTIFLLTATHQKLIPETIVSRCRVYPFSLLDESHMQNLLTQREVTGKEAEEAMTIAQGRVEHLVRLLEDSQFFEMEREQFQMIAQLFHSKDRLRKLNLADELNSGTRHEDLLVFLDNFGRFLRSVLIEKAKGSQLEVANGFAYRDLLDIYRHFLQTRYGIQANANKKLLLEQLLLSVP